MGGGGKRPHKRTSQSQDNLLDFIEARTIRVCVPPPIPPPQARRRSPRPPPADEDEDPADGDEAVLEGGHGQDGELGSVLQREDGEQPPAPGRTTGTGLQGGWGGGGDQVNTQAHKQ